MVVFNENNEILDECDLESGRLIDKIMRVLHTCQLDGSVVTTGVSGEPIENYDGHIPGNMLPGDRVMGKWPVKVYIPYTDEELKVKRITSQTAVAMQMLVVQADLPDEKALLVEALYPEWTINETYKIGDICRYNDNLYRCLLDNVATEVHTPDVSVALWKQILPAEEPGGYLPWVQPLGATDAYDMGDRVTHNDKVWESIAYSNIWEPGVYGWVEVNE